MQAYREDGFPITIVRPSLTYGDTQIPLAVNSWAKSYTVVDRMRRGKKVIVPGDGIVALGHHSQQRFRQRAGRPAGPSAGHRPRLPHHLRRSHVLGSVLPDRRRGGRRGAATGPHPVRFPRRLPARASGRPGGRQVRQRGLRQHQDQALRAGLLRHRAVCAGHPPDAGLVRCRPGPPPGRRRSRRRPGTNCWTPGKEEPARLCTIFRPPDQRNVPPAGRVQEDNSRKPASPVQRGIMFSSNRSARVCLLLAGLLALPAFAQTPQTYNKFDNSANASLHGAYFVREVVLTVCASLLSPAPACESGQDPQGTVGTAISAIGTLTFDGSRRLHLQRDVMESNPATGTRNPRRAPLTAATARGQWLSVDRQHCRQLSSTRRSDPVDIAFGGLGVAGPNAFAASAPESRIPIRSLGSR